MSEHLEPQSQLAVGSEVPRIIAGGGRPAGAAAKELECVVVNAQREWKEVAEMG